jgi:Glycosyltransferase sugar-binding region containing DXD motif
MIPNIFHFVFGMAPDFGGKPFSLVHYLAIKSATELNKPLTVFFHYQYEPEGHWWQKAKPLLTLNRVEAPKEIFGNPLLHVAHQADVVRLQMLRETGGIYMDLDTISVKPFTHLLQHSFVIGEELGAPRMRNNWFSQIKNRIWKPRPPGVKGLCNAIMLAEKNSPFVNRWLESYHSFRSKGRDQYWSEHSVRLPMQLALAFPAEITRLGPYHFHYPLYHAEGLKQMFAETHTFPDALAHHLWESFAWEPYMKHLTVNHILTQTTTYNLLARPFIGAGDAP